MREVSKCMTLRMTLRNRTAVKAPMFSCSRARVLDTTKILPLPAGLVWSQGSDRYVAVTHIINERCLAFLPSCYYFNVPARHIMSSEHGTTNNGLSNFADVKGLSRDRPWLLPSVCCLAIACFKNPRVRSWADPVCDCLESQIETSPRHILTQFNPLSTTD